MQCLKFRKSIVFFLCAGVSALHGYGVLASAGVVVYTTRKIITMGSSLPVAAAVAVREGRIGGAGREIC